jgi:hypothetical protein
VATVSDGFITGAAHANETRSDVGRRVVVLGASNARRGLARLAGVLRDRASPAAVTGSMPVELLLAIGHGRSYGATSRVWLRRLPSILRCGLWNALDRETRGDADGMALVTDIGNDLLYGFPPAQVADWVHECVGRLSDRGLRVVVTRLPLESVARLGPVRFRVLRSLYVPGCPLTLPALAAAAADLDDRVARITASCGATLLEQPGDWYGIDAIHVRRRRLGDLWHRAADAWGLPPASLVRRRRVGRARLADWALLGSRAAEVRSLAGVMRYTRQPVLTRDRLRVWMW